MNNAYKVGFWKDVEVDDSTTVEEFVPVSSFSWTLNYKTGRRKFTDTGSADNSFWENTYFNLDGSGDETKYWSLTNTVGVSLLEEFNKFAKFGLTAFVTHEIRKYNQYHDTIPDDDKRPEGLTPYPVSSAAVKGNTKSAVGRRSADQTTRLNSYLRGNGTIRSSRKFDR